jgi:K+-sensing histidine kinase KdpD
VSDTALHNVPKLPSEIVAQLRSLAHDLSNSLETILQASYLLAQAKTDANGKKWARMIETAAQDAARVNREMRTILKSQS